MDTMKIQTRISEKLPENNSQKSIPILSYL